MNLILGTSSNYDIPNLRAFALSMKKHCDADAVLLVDKTPRNVLTWLGRQGVVTREFSIPNMPPHQARFFGYHEFLSRHERYERIFITDVRDVIAQGDLFSSPHLEPGLHVFREDPRLPLGGDKLVSDWIRLWYGEEWHGRLAEKTIICSGTTFGDRASMLCYLDTMLAEFRAKHRENEKFKREFSDQGPHNKLAYSGELAENLERIGMKLHIRHNGEAVLTAGLRDTFTIVQPGVVVNDDGSIPEIVHQYDRHFFLRTMVDYLYADRQPAFGKRYEKFAGRRMRPIKKLFWRILRNV
ncbi:MAG: hypothetical protein LBJ46_05120 [Planctomycetota bacterium]|jgi:hypothetical protein|nr:hypothetical protein [Planctomycetota bacterium]